MKPLQLQLSVKLVHTVYAYTYNHCGGILVAYPLNRCKCSHPRSCAYITELTHVVLRPTRMTGGWLHLQRFKGYEPYRSPVLAHWLMKVGDGYHSGRAQADGRAIK
jgi:hypothetical protein